MIISSKLVFSYLPLSTLFLSVTCPKLLVLSGTDKLDSHLTRAHMQGKYQLAIIYHTGHLVHEDQPVKFTHILQRFITRNTNS